jgi:hypothetical protein
MRTVDSVSKSPIALLYRRKVGIAGRFDHMCYSMLYYTLYYTSYTYAPHTKPSTTTPPPPTKNTFPQLRRAVTVTSPSITLHTKHKLNSGHQAKPSKPSKSNRQRAKPTMPSQWNSTWIRIHSRLGSEGKGRPPYTLLCCALLYFTLRLLYSTLHYSILLYFTFLCFALLCFYSTLLYYHITALYATSLLTLLRCPLRIPLY